MRLAALLAALALCGASPAWAADCGLDLGAVREAALAAGPFRSVEHFKSSDGKTSVRSSTIIIDVIRPDRMRRISILENGKTGHMVLIGGSGWSANIDSKWEPLDTGFVTKMLASVMQNSPWPPSDTQVSCGLLPGEDGRPGIAKFSFLTTEGEATIEHEVLADRETKLPVGYRARRTLTNGTPYTESARTFYFIGTLEIEAP